VKALFERMDPSIPRWFGIWLAVCLVVFSPLRYIILQVIVASAYAVQSVGAFISIFPLALYVPIVFGILYLIGVGLPLYVTLRVAVGNLKTSQMAKGRLALASLTAPVVMLVGYTAFFWLLQFATLTVHWLRAEDVIGATNGPAYVSYHLVLGHLMPLTVMGYYAEVTHNDRDMLRNHIASFYLGEKSETRYVRLAYPALYARLTTQP